MRRVARIMPFTVSPATWMAAIVVAAVWTAGALAIAHRIASTEQPSFPRSVMTLPASEPRQTSNSAAKAAREPFSRDALAPGPSRLDASRRAPQDETSRLDASRRAPQDEASGAKAQTGRASWYDLDAKTASGEVMDADALTAAHPSLPFGSKVRVANLRNGRSVVVRINDRGPFTKDRIIDVSRAAAKELGMIGAGVARVSVTPLDDAVASGEVASASGEAQSSPR